MFAIQIITDESKVGDCVALIYDIEQDIQTAERVMKNPNKKIYKCNYHIKGYELIEKAILWLERVEMAEYAERMKEG